MLIERCFPLAILFLSGGIAIEARNVEDDVPLIKEVLLVPLKYELGGHFILNCTLPHIMREVSYYWKKNGTPVEAVADLKYRYKLEEYGAVFRLLTRATEDDYGNYTCGIIGINEDVYGWQLQAKPVARLPSGINVVEGQKLKLECRVVGKPYPTVMWTFSNGSFHEVEVKAALGSRVWIERSERGLENGELVVEAARPEDAGIYTCTPGEDHPATTSVRVQKQEDYITFNGFWPVYIFKTRRNQP